MLLIINLYKFTVYSRCWYKLIFRLYVSRVIIFTDLIKLKIVIRLSLILQQRLEFISILSHDRIYLYFTCSRFTLIEFDCTHKIALCRISDKSERGSELREKSEKTPENRLEPRRPPSDPSRLTAPGPEVVDKRADEQPYGRKSSSSLSHVHSSAAIGTLCSICVPDPLHSEQVPSIVQLLKSYATVSNLHLLLHV